MRLKHLQNKECFIFSSFIDFNSPTILAYYIISSTNGLKTNGQYFIIDESNAYLIENKMPTKHWTVTKTSFDEKGGEFITKEGDTISLSKNILIITMNGEEIGYEYEAIDVSQVIIDSDYLMK